MRSKVNFLLGLVTAGAVAIGIQGPSLAQEDGAGRTLFIDYGCWQCHGYEGQGGASGPRVAPTLFPYAAFEQLVRKPPNIMPAYAPSGLSDESLREIFVYLRSIQEPPALKDIPELR